MTDINSIAKSKVANALCVNNIISTDTITAEEHNGHANHGCKKLKADPQAVVATNCKHLSPEDLTN